MDQHSFQYIDASSSYFYAHVHNLDQPNEFTYAIGSFPKDEKRDDIVMNKFIEDGCTYLYCRGSSVDSSRNLLNLGTEMSDDHFVEKKVATQKNLAIYIGNQQPILVSNDIQDYVVLILDENISL